MSISIETLQSMKHDGEPITMLTCYDASFASLIDNAGIEVILVGDSLGNVIQGHKTTVPVTLEQMVYHCQCVKNGTENTFIIADMPFMSYFDEFCAFETAKALMQAGAMMVKLEGGTWLVPVVEKLVQCGIPVCAHLGLQPQSVHRLGGFKQQGKTSLQKQQLLADAKALESSGVQLLIVECITAELAYAITQSLEIPVIGIGSGQQVDGQVMVLYDILGISGSIPGFAKNFLHGAPSIKVALQNYRSYVRNPQG